MSVSKREGIVSAFIYFSLVVGIRLLFGPTMSIQK